MNQIAYPQALKAAATYDAAADTFDDPRLGFWQRHGLRTVERLELRPGERVLDVGCGSGSSALPAAAAVGPSGAVTGLDVAQRMLSLARAKAAAQGLGNLRFDAGDMAALDETEASFDAVVSVFSVFFVPDIERQVAALWRLLRPGGRLAVTVWDRGAFEPAVEIFGTALREVRPDLLSGARPWERLTAREPLHRLFLDAGATTPMVWAFPDRQPLSRPADWWTIALGSGFRWEIDQLTRVQRDAVRKATLEGLSKRSVTSIETGALCAIAVKP